jgi:hypothetical protein
LGRTVGAPDTARAAWAAWGAGIERATVHAARAHLIRWRRPVLTISNNSYDGDYERHGQGIVLVPGIGRLRTVTTMVNPWEPVTIGYPISTTQYADPPDVVASRQLVELLGRTKARVLSRSNPDPI